MDIEDDEKICGCGCGCVGNAIAAATERYKAEMLDGNCVIFNSVVSAVTSILRHNTMVRFCMEVEGMEVNEANSVSIEDSRTYAEMATAISLDRREAFKALIEKEFGAKQGKDRKHVTN